MGSLLWDLYFKGPFIKSRRVPGHTLRPWYNGNDLLTERLCTCLAQRQLQSGSGRHDVSQAERHQRRVACAAQGEGRPDQFAAGTFYDKENYAKPITV